MTESLQNSLRRETFVVSILRSALHTSDALPSFSSCPPKKCGIFPLQLQFHKFFLFFSLMFNSCCQAKFWHTLWTNMNFDHLLLETDHREHLISPCNCSFTIISLLFSHVQFLLPSQNFKNTLWIKKNYHLLVETCLSELSRIKSNRIDYVHSFLYL